MSDDHFIPLKLKRRTARVMTEHINLHYTEVHKLGDESGFPIVATPATFSGTLRTLHGLRWQVTGELTVAETTAIMEILRGAEERALAEIQHRIEYGDDQ